MLATRRVFWEPGMLNLLLRPGLRPGPRWASLQCSPDPLAGKGEGPQGGKRIGGRERERKGRAGNGRGGHSGKGERREGREEGERRGRK